MKPLRNGTSWNLLNGVIEDKTRSGKPKRRLSHSQDYLKFTVKFHFTYEQYEIFISWWENQCYYGLNSFKFKKIDSINGKDYEYRIVANTQPSINNIGGDILECSMQWEELKVIE